MVEDLVGKECQMLSEENLKRIMVRKTRSDESISRGRHRVVRLQARKSSWHGCLLISGILLISELRVTIILGQERFNLKRNI